MFPQLGAAGTTYARSVPSSVIRPGALPDPDLIYDSVMKRTEFKPHPNNVSSFLWHWASIIIHGRNQRRCRRSEQDANDFSQTSSGPTTPT